MEHWLNPFVPNAPFLYPLKTSENVKVGHPTLGTNGLKWANDERYF